MIPAERYNPAKHGDSALVITAATPAWAGADYGLKVLMAMVFAKARECQFQVIGQGMAVGEDQGFVREWSMPVGVIGLN